MSSLCALAVPYMLPRDGEFNRLSPPEYSVTLSPMAVENAVAKSIGRFGIALSWSIVLLCMRLAIFTFVYELPSWLLVIVIIAEIGRAVLVISQHVSTITYSASYKGVSTWASPLDTGSKWAGNKKKQDAFRAVLLKELGYNFIAISVFYMIEGLWRWVWKIFV